MDCIYVNMIAQDKKQKEVDIDKEFHISLIKQITFDEEDEEIVDIPSSLSISTNCAFFPSSNSCASRSHASDLETMKAARNAEMKPLIKIKTPAFIMGPYISEPT